MHEIWSSILGEELEPGNLDRHTVRLLHLRMPACSAYDTLFVDTAMRASTIFPAAKSWRIRQRLLSRILAREKILTFQSFHADMVLLEACYQPLRQLWPQKTTSLRQACRMAFQNPGAQFEASYAEVWLYSIRHHAELLVGGSERRKARNSQDPSGYLPSGDPAFVGLASYVASLGFRTEAIEVFPGVDVQSEKDRDATPVPALSGGLHEVRLQHRCGFPPRAVFDQWWSQLCSRTVFYPCNETVRGHATPFAVAKTFVQFLLDYAPSYHSSRPGTLVDCQERKECCVPSSWAGPDTTRMSAKSRAKTDPGVYIEPLGGSSCSSRPMPHRNKHPAVLDTASPPRRRTFDHGSRMAVGSLLPGSGVSRNFGKNDDQRHGLPALHPKPHPVPTSPLTCPSMAEDSTGKMDKSKGTIGLTSYDPQPGRDNIQPAQTTHTLARKAPEAKVSRKVTSPAAGSSAIKQSRVTKPKHTRAGAKKEDKRQLRALRLVEMHCLHEPKNEAD